MTYLRLLKFILISKRKKMLILILKNYLKNCSMSFLGARKILGIESRATKHLTTELHYPDQDAAPFSFLFL
jgi:hypothetical protein